ncbi:NucA/NucB deoxyribonuclease domain-containing protein [Amycolatopsis japonica]|uniref:NucA/NucB deoxyribonuclease domain-containing protein n=1 Tax=Amycolatopsis japonica TaxID=208439 RepID=UPI0037FB33C6
MSAVFTSTVALAGPASADAVHASVNRSTMSVQQQGKQCAERAAGRGTPNNFECTVVTSTDSALPTTDSPVDTNAASMPLATRRTGGDATPQAISPACLLGVSNPYRTISCSTKNWTVTHYREVNGVKTPVGTIDLRIRSSVDFQEGQGSTPAWDLDVEVTVTKTWGTLQAGTSANSWTGCFGHQDKCTTSRLGGSNDENEPVALTPNAQVNKWYTQYSASMLNNQVLPLTGNLGSALELTTPANPVTIADHYSNTLWGRCDNMGSNRYGSGCVDDKGVAFVMYSTIDNPKVEQVADHVYDAIRTLPSHWGRPYAGKPLTRLTDEAAIDANRRIACGSGTPPSCDEYPLASSYEGGNGAAPGDRSTRTVTIEANNSQGGITIAYFDYYRVLDKDEFYVQAIKKDGSRAW